MNATMTQRFCFAALILGLSAGCLSSCSSPPKTIPQPQFDPQAGVVVAEAATSVNHSLIELDQIQQEATPRINISVPPDPSSIGLGTTATIRWYGPPEPVISQIAKMASFQFRTLGTPPSQPIIVRLEMKQETLAAILQNIGLQCKDQATLAIFPNSKTIELRYQNKGGV